MNSTRLPRRLALSAAVGAAGLVLAACGSTSSPAADQPMAGMGSSASGSAMGSGMGGGSGPSPSAPRMGQRMVTDSPTSGPTGAPAAGPHTTADLVFLMQMIPHHIQAVAMADLAATRAKSPQVRTLAAQIKAAQGPEITEMSGWLRDWSAPVPSGDMSSGTAMSGMMSAADLAKLAELTGTAFDRTWLTMMTGHHQSALVMARTELTTGSNPEVMILARSIITSQTAQLTRMKTMLSRLPGS